MANYRTKNKLLLAKVEAISGQDAGPTVGADAVLAEEPRQDPEFEVIQTNEIGASLDSRGPTPGSAPGGRRRLHGHDLDAAPQGRRRRSLGRSEQATWDPDPAEPPR